MKIEHIAIWTQDLEKMRQFYENYFGATSNEKYVNEQKGFSSYFLTFSEGTRLELMHMDCIPLNQNDPFDQAHGIIHFAFSTGSEAEVDTLTDKLRENGYEHLDGPRRTGDGYYESCVLDPEGNRIEITA